MILFVGSLKTLAGGLLGLIAAAGIGSGILRGLGPIPSRWRWAASLLCGVASIDLAVMLVLFSGGGVRGVRLVGAGAVLVGGCILLLSWSHLALAPALKSVHNSNRCFIAVIVVAVSINLLIALAPSTKIDELYYHMLIPKRIMEDDGLLLYREPFEAAIFPQTGFQLGLSAAHAAGFPEAGNVVSWGLGAVLVLLVAGVTADLTGSTAAGWITGAISAVGLYPSVWHVTSGPHALGDLALVSASLLALLSDGQTGDLKAQPRLILVCLAAYAAASTKITILPVAATITLIGVHRAAVRIGWKKAVGIALGVWTTFYGPILLWTALRSGSPFGLATATLFHSHYFGADDIVRMENARRLGPTGWRAVLAWLAPSVSIGMVAAFGVVAYAALKRQGVFRVVGGLVFGQSVLIACLLPHEFRFLGGLQYVVLILGAWVLWPSPMGMRIMSRWWTVLFGMCLPWLAVQAYYARPFVKVVTGIVTRDSFLHEHVAFTEDFGILNRLLPADAVLYVVNTRLPSYYAPRPVIFTLEDLRGRKPLYRFAGESDPLPDQGSLSCTETVYENRHAVDPVFRTPGRAAGHQPVKVERCEVARAVRADQ